MITDYHERYSLSLNIQELFTVLYIFFDFWNTFLNFEKNESLI